MKHQTFLITAVLVLLASLPLANFGVEKAKAQEGGGSMEADWGKLNAAEKSLLAGNHFMCMGWLDYMGRPYGLDDLPEALEAFQEAIEYRDRYQRLWPNVDWKSSNTELYTMFEALSERSTHRYENRDLTFASKVWTELMLQAEWCEKRSRKTASG